jgi:hypothetical protein
VTIALNPVAGFLVALAVIWLFARYVPLSKRGE